jgi:hypothetical protein
VVQPHGPRSGHFLRVQEQIRSDASRRGIPLTKIQTTEGGAVCRAGISFDASCGTVNVKLVVWASMIQQQLYNGTNTGSDLRDPTSRTHCRQQFLAVSLGAPVQADVRRAAQGYPVELRRQSLFTVPTRQECQPFTGYLRS